MSLSVIGPWTLGGNGPWIMVVPELDAIAVRSMIQTDDGVCQGWSGSGRIWAGPLVTPSGAKTAADAAAASARSTAQGAENGSATQAQNALALLDAQTATLAQLNTVCARLIRYVAANVPRPIQ